MCGLDSDSDGRPDVQLNCTGKQCDKVFVITVLASCLRPIRSVRCYLNYQDQ